VAAKAAESTTLVEVKKSNLKQSPLKMQFLAMLVRDTWLPDALAQLKFSPKHKAVDLAKMVKVELAYFKLSRTFMKFSSTSLPCVSQRAVAIAKLNYDAIPEELRVKEIIVNKGASYKKIRIMGRGRTGIGKIRSTHVTIKVDKVDFNKCITDARTPRQKDLWTTRLKLVEKIRASPPAAPKV
jgi:ribosomal protein L22